MYEGIGFPRSLYRRCVPAFSLAKRKGFGQKRSFGWMRRALRRGRMRVFSLRLSAELPKGLCAVEGEDSARGATVRARTEFATPHSGARPSRGGSPPRRLPPCTRASRRGRVKQVQDGFRHIGERILRDHARAPFVSAHHPFGDQPKAPCMIPSRIRA